MPHAFLSYVGEDLSVAKALSTALQTNGVDVWLDKESIKPGHRWKDAIRDAIKAGMAFVPIFSTSWSARERTVANEELIIAIEELRLRPRGIAWFIPIRVNNCEIPDHPIGAGERLSDIQFIDVPALGWQESLTRLLRALGVADPIVPEGEPLAPGLPSQVRLIGGELTYLRTDPDIPQFRGMVFHVSSGWCARSADGMLAYLECRAPNANLQQLNIQFGLNAIYARSDDHYISADADHPNLFGFENSYVLPKGAQMYDSNSGTYLTLPIDLPASTDFTARGHIRDRSYLGDFTARIEYRLGATAIPVTMLGTFVLQFEPDDAPPRA